MVSEEDRVRYEKLGQAGGGERVFGGNIERWAREAMRCGKLSGKKQR